MASELDHAGIAGYVLGALLTAIGAYLIARSVAEGEKGVRDPIWPLTPSEALAATALVMFWLGFIVRGL